VECQRGHRREHKPKCGPDFSEDSLLQAASSDFEALMAASEAALQDANDPEMSASRPDAVALQLEESLQMAGSFLARRASVAPALAADHAFAYYARGNFVKQAFTRLTMRVTKRYHREPRGGCGLLATRTREQLEICLGAAVKALPRFHVEVLSLLRDVRDLRDLVVNLEGLADDLATCEPPQPQLGEVSEEGFSEVKQWCTTTLKAFAAVLDAYGEAP